MLVSAAMIVKNESRCILRCLESIKNAVDEIVIVDTGSSDNTVQLIEEYRKDKKNIRLYFFDWKDDFAAARNFAISKTRGKWKFSIDADEFLHPDDVTKVREACKVADFYNLHNIVADIELLNIKGEEVFDRVTEGVLRIFKGVFYYEGKIHEQLTNDEMVKGVRVKMPIRLFHDGYDSEVVNTIRKALRNIKLLEAVIQSEPENYMNYIYFSQTSMIAGNLDMALNSINIAEKLYFQKNEIDPTAENFLNRTKENILNNILHIAEVDLRIEQNTTN